ncbi:MAG: HAD family phosphatase [Planctomycetota bacterium]|nr:HAD family phosphatase [Planctomycetota bacterium]
MKSPETRSPETVSIEAVAFDMDGLLLNTEDLYEEVTKALLAKRGKVFKEEVRRRMIGLPAPKAYQVLIESELLEETWEQLHEETELVFEGLLEERLETMPGVREIFEAIDRKGLPRCVATSSTKGFAHKALAKVGILQQLDFVVTAEEVTRGKPYPDIYVEAAKRMQKPIERMLVLEDSETGTKAGVSAGAYVISVPNRHTSNGIFHGAKWIAESLNDDRIFQLLK